MTLLELLFKVSLNLLSQFIYFVSRDNSFFNELLLVSLRWRRHASNLFVHHRLCETWLIDLIVSIVPVTNHVKHDVLPVLGPILNCESASLDHSINIVCIYAKDWNLKGLYKIGRILKAPVVCGLCRESDLIVCNNVHRSST